jgi:hypothetical protein
MDVGPITKLQYLTIGSEGENDAVSIVIDVNDWIDELVERGYESPCFHILFKPYNQVVPLTCDANTVFDRDAGTLTWTITQSITQYAGLGYTEIRALNHPDNGLLKKSKIIPTMVNPSITGADGGVIPAPYDDWVNSILALIDNLNNALDQAQRLYAVSDSGTTTPDASDFSTELPDLVLNKGKFLWTRTDIHWSTGATSSLYAVSYLALDGEGAVDSVNGLAGAIQLDGRNLYVDISQSQGNRMTLNAALANAVNAINDALDDVGESISGINDEIGGIGDEIDTINDTLPTKLNSSMIVYTTGSQPSNPVTGMIWLKKK